jgi:hypothetical protein
MLQGCATLNVQLTKKDVVTWALTIYSDQYDSYLEDVLKPTVAPEIRQAVKKNPKLLTPDMIRTDIPEEKRIVLREKKKILTKLWAVLLTIRPFIDTGQTPPADMEEQLISLTNQLINMVERRISRGQIDSLRNS